MLTRQPQLCRVFFENYSIKNYTMFNYITLMQNNIHINSPNLEHLDITCILKTSQISKRFDLLPNSQARVLTYFLICGWF